MATPRWLNPGEDVVLDVSPHWSFLGRPLVAVVVLLAGAITAVATGAPGVVDALLAVLLVAGLLWLVARYARWATTTLVLTGERLIQRKGVVGKRVREVPLSQISEVDCRRRVRDRALRTGDVVVVPVGQPPEVFDHLPRPTAIVRELHRQIDRSRRQTLMGGAFVSVPEQLQRLDDLRRRGAMSQTEFDDQKARLLQRW